MMGWLFIAPFLTFGAAAIGLHIWWIWRGL